MIMKSILKTNVLTATTVGVLLISLPFIGCKKSNGSGNINKVNHVVVIYLENHSFDNLYGQFPGANGLANATAATITQDSATGNPYTFLPTITESSAFPTNLPNGLFNI